MKESKWLKYVKPNEHIYQEVNGNKTHFTDFIIKSYSNLNQNDFGGLHWYVKQYFKDHVIENNVVKKEITIEDEIQEDRKIRALNSKLQDITKKKCLFVGKINSTRTIIR